MSIETVQNASQHSNVLSFATENLFVIILWLFVTTVIYLGILSFLSGGEIRWFFRGNPQLSFFISMFTFAFCFGILYVFYLSAIPSDWEKTYAKPYIDSLPFNEEEIDIISASNVSEDLFHVSYLSSANGKLIRHETDTAIKRSSDKGKVPIYRYKVVSEDLAPEHSNREYKYEAGHYKKIIFIPLDYSLPLE